MMHTLAKKYHYDRDTEQSYRIPSCCNGHAQANRIPYDVARYDVLIFECEICNSQVAVIKVG